MIAPVALALVVLVITGAVTGSAATQGADPAPLTLRLSDLPKGWRVGDDTGCGPMGVEGATPEVAALVRELHPQVCVREFNKVWAGGKEFYVQSLAMTFTADGGADRAFAVTPGLFDFFGFEGAVRSSTAVSIGDRSQVFLQPKGYPPGPQPSPETAVAWLSGEIYSFVVSAARTQGDATAAAVAYARAQQARIDTPTPIVPMDFDDLFVELDNPNLPVPVWWLGQTYDPPGALPQVTLQYAHASTSRSLPGQTADLTYGTSQGEQPGGGAWIFTWTPSAWARWTKLGVGQIGWKSPCARSTTLRVPAGLAIIWRAYWSTPKTRPCPKRAPDVAFAHVYARGSVITVNSPICWMCKPRELRAWDSVDGLRAVVLGLRRR